MKVQQLLIDSDEEVVRKVIKEVLNLFKITVIDASDDFELQGNSAIAAFDIRHKISMNSIVRVKTCLTIRYVGGSQDVLEKMSEGCADEHPRAARHRLIKRNLYDLLLKHFDFFPVPWGILHGVRPTKIVHRLIRDGMEEDEIVNRLIEHYRASYEKARYMTRLAFRQLPFLAQSDSRTVSVYVGIPFCRTRCLYCSFPAYILPTEEELSAFFAVWKKDLEAAKEAIDRYGLKVQTIYVGGGTPTSLPDNVFHEMLALVRSSLYRAETVEFTVEAGRPDTITKAKAQSMAALGVTRVSVNPQTMQARTLRRIGRAHTPENVEEMYRLLKGVGDFSVNMDIILGLPGETRDDVRDTMRRVLALHPEDVTLHSLALKRGSILKMHLEAYELPADEEVQAMFDEAMGQVLEAGLQPYYLYRQGYMAGDLENVGCARPGEESIYNIQIMEENQTIIGVGCAATSKVVNHSKRRMRSAFNAKDMITYLRDIDVYIEKRAALLEEVYTPL
ncbi:coproporphyrinogen III oxidase [Selenomonas sp. TAMA-11512]|uniref:coproporphyrinogen dehydrogenase HemZ n=1 Tax=Selenomonas sp. TAMA-11512 TaxID=3095337 RepID=UPI0030930F9B|nr:coproporphyrinogen III oxidase [Selenomonas sp. TAMA-11512]